MARLTLDVCERVSSGESQPSTKSSVTEARLAVLREGSRETAKRTIKTLVRESSSNIRDAAITVPQMRILHLNSGNLYGGIETLLATLARHRALCPDMEPEFGLCFDGRSSEELQQTGAPVHRICPARVSRPWTIWRARRILARLLAERAFDVVVCHGSWNHALFAPVIRQRGVPLVFWAHGPIAGNHWLDRWANSTPADLVVTNSHWTQDNVQLFSGVRTEVIYPPVGDTMCADWVRERRDIRTELATAEDTVVIIQACRLEAWKGHSLLLEALARLGGLPGWECWIAGGAQRPEEVRYLAGLRAKAAAAGLAARVKFLGQRSDVPRVLAGADIHCQPNLGPEPFGIAFVEALYAGLPVVTTAHGGALEIVDETCGLVVPPNDAQVLSKELAHLIAARVIRRRLGEKGPARARMISDPFQCLHHLAGTLRHLAA